MAKEYRRLPVAPEAIDMGSDRGECIVGYEVPFVWGI